MIGVLNQYWKSKKTVALEGKLTLRTNLENKKQKKSKCFRRKPYTEKTDKLEKLKC